MSAEISKNEGPSARFEPRKSTKSAGDDGTADFLCVLAIGLIADMTVWYLEFDEIPRALLLAMTTCTIIAAAARCGNGGRESLLVNTTLGLLTQYMCHLFDLGRIMHAVMALSACFAIYHGAERNNSSAKRTPASDHDGSNHMANDPQHSGRNRTSIWPIFAIVVVTVTLAIALFTRQPSTNNCIALSRQLDCTHWEAIIIDKTLSNTGCDVAAQLALAEREINAYTRNIQKDACHVSCIKQNNAGHWTAYVSVSPPGSEVDGTYCGEAYSLGDCGKGFVQRRVDAPTTIYRAGQTPLVRSIRS